MTNGRIISITELRRRFGEITETLPYSEPIIITRGGEPFAILKASKEEKGKILRKAAGAWKGTALDSDAIWKEVFKRKSRKKAVVL